ncbi:hypothetical protein B0T18DRAFT_404332 [Schizothecium vesticola]|uniref:Uncharacterized protein n=1 Tax=Schizothecium vesticola TaxID=314040 RepID=A0AA40F6K6_9PEZI|nr:hypothetical protein B0T18DRAFT_404332 [Schizothecium vesticola]
MIFLPATTPSTPSRPHSAITKVPSADEALETYARTYGNLSEPVEDYHLLSVAAAMEGMRALENCPEVDGERISCDAAKSSLAAVVAREVEKLLDIQSGLQIDLNQRKDMFTHAAG